MHATDVTEVFELVYIYMQIVVSDIHSVILLSCY